MLLPVAKTTAARHTGLLTEAEQELLMPQWHGVDRMTNGGRSPKCVGGKAQTAQPLMEHSHDLPSVISDFFRIGRSDRIAFPHDSRHLFIELQYCAGSVSGEISSLVPDLSGIPTTLTSACD